ncbi:type III pantothenate kinase [Persephonella sp.]
MIIGVDVGNTTVEVGFIYSAKKIVSYKLKTDHGKTADDWFLDLRQLMDINGKPEPDDCVISSVVPIVDSRLERAFVRLTGKKPLFVGREIPVPIKNNYKNPDEVGIDRLVNSFAGLRKYGTPLIVVDFGTAVTFDVVSKDGAYEGGAIFPGIDASITALFSKTAKLPSVNLTDADSVVGKTTSDSIKAGLFFGYVSLVEGMVKRINDETGHIHSVVLTGGGGKIISSGISIPHTFDPSLSMEGIYLIYEHWKNY